MFFLQAHGLVMELERFYDFIQAAFEYLRQAVAGKTDAMIGNP